MGIRKLFQFINQFAPESVESIPVEQLNGWVIGIDMSIFIYQWCAIGRTKHIVNKSGKFINHIQGTLFRMMKILSLGIIPVCIFDGKPPIIKNHTIKKREKSEKIPAEVFNEVKKLLSMMGVMIIESPSEAEAQAAALARAGLIRAVMTEDGDALVFGAPLLIRGFNTASKSVTVINRDILLDKLDIDSSQFIDLCIMLGSDYTVGLNINHKKALALIKKYENIDRIIEQGQCVPRDFNYAAARAEFIAPVVNTYISNPHVKSLSPADLGKLQHYLVILHGLDIKKVEKVIHKLADFHRFYFCK